MTEDTAIAVFSGFVIGVYLVFVFINIFPSGNERELLRCKDAELANISLIWQGEYPFCKTEVTINGNTKIVTLPEYYEYTK